MLATILKTVESNHLKATLKRLWLKKQPRHTLQVMFQTYFCETPKILDSYKHKYQECGLRNVVRNTYKIRES